MKIGPHIEVTQEMIEAALVSADMTDEDIAALYRRMRALEPGPHQGAPLRDVVPATMGVRKL